MATASPTGPTRCILSLPSCNPSSAKPPAQINAALQPLAGQIRFAALYGSLAKGVNHARSDVDLLIVGDLNLEQALAAIVPVEGRIGREISVRIYSAEDFRTRREQGEHFINNVMSGPLTPLIGSAGDA